MKKTRYLAVVMLALLAMSTGALSQEPRSIVGTTWAGMDSDGDFYEYTFLKGGQLRYRTNTARKELVTFENKGDVWAQNGQIVMLSIRDYSTQIGTLSADRIEGKAWNVKERRWTWEVKEKR